jgi:hypothetical protein
VIGAPVEADTLWSVIAANTGCLLSSLDPKISFSCWDTRMKVVRRGSSFRRLQQRERVKEHGISKKEGVQQRNQTRCHRVIHALTPK